jgi:flagellar biosynthesis protein FlhB
MADNGQRTEQPTQRRVDRARREGHFPASKEFVSSVQLLGFVAITVSLGGAWFGKTAQFVRTMLSRAPSIELTPGWFVQFSRGAVLSEILPLLLGGLALIFLVLFAQFATTRFGVSAAKLAPDFKRLSPLSRLKNLPAQNLPVLLQELILLPVIGYAVYYEAAEHLEEFMALSWMNAQGGALRVASALKTLLWRGAALFLVIGIADLFWQQRRYRSQLRMTKQEIREEVKEQQGNPQIKMRIRRLQRDLLRRQMMKEVPKATAVIVNPTHYAVAIRYSFDSGGAPKVVAKGKNYLALRIRQKALEHQVPIVENPPLAQALYKSVEVGQEIPVHLYRAIAEILAYIYRLMNGRLPGA